MGLTSGRTTGVYGWSFFYGRMLAAWIVLGLFITVLSPRAMAIDLDTIRIGGDYRIFKMSVGSTADACRRACDKDDRCRSWTFIKQRVKTSDGIRFNLSPDFSVNLGGRKKKVIPPQCRLKHSAGQKQYNRCCTSGIKKVVRRRARSNQCADYAEQALLQNDKNLSRQCGYRGKFWHDSYGRHYDWCMDRNRRQSNRKVVMRKEKLRECRDDRPGRDRGCDRYAGTAIKILEKAEENKCRNTNRSWPEEYERVYEWCVGKSASRRDAAMDRAQDKLSSCLRRIDRDEDYYDDDDRFDDSGSFSVKPEKWVNAFGRKAGGWVLGKTRRMMADVNGDGKMDVVGFSDKGVSVSLARRDRFARPGVMTEAYGNAPSSWIFEMADVNGDGKADIVAFGENGVYVSLARRNGFSGIQKWVTGFGSRNGGWNKKDHIRKVADVNGDGKADIVGFGDGGVYVSLARNGRFTKAEKWVSAFGRKAGSWNRSDHFRTLADVNGDGKADIVGFGNAGVYVSLARNGRFTRPEKWVGAFGRKAGGWSKRHHVRRLADVNGDGKADIVGFADTGVFVSLARNGRFTRPEKWVAAYGRKAGGWDRSRHPRIMADMNGDGKADIVGFGNAGVFVSLARRNGFGRPEKWVSGFGYNAGGWRRKQHPRTATDVDGDKKADIIGFGDGGVFVALGKAARR